MLLAGLVSHPSPIPPLVWTVLLSAAGLLIGLFLFFEGFPLLRRKRLIQDTPVSTVRGAALGSVGICGKAVGPYTLLSPISGLDCYYYRVEVWQGVEEGRNHRWKKRADEMLSTPLFIEDETGRLLIDPRDAEVQVAPDREDESCAAELSRRFLEHRGIPAGDPVRITEYSIKPGDQIFVLGTLCQNDKPASFLSAQAADLQRRGVLETLHVYAGDKKTGLVPEFNLDVSVVLCKGEGNSPFIISRESPKEMVQDLASKAGLYVWGGGLLALVCLGILLAAAAR